MLRTENHGAITRVDMARTLAGRSIYTVAAFHLGDTLVDSGCAHTARELVRWCRGRSVDQVVNTHYHEDHTGGNAALAATYGVPILAPPGAIPTLASFYPLPAYRRLTWGQPRNHTAQPLGGEVTIAGRTFTVIPTPGHSDDHVCLFEPQDALLFSGDLYINGRARYLRRGEDAWQILASLRKVAAMRPRLMVCAHAGFITEPATAIQAKIAYWEGLAQQAATLRRQGASVRAITQRLLGREGTLSWLSLGEFSKQNLIRSLLREPQRGATLAAPEPCPRV
jgi:glyoxylase-like metal-dependent hydrolase (beta-lactamase superfamily II)